MLKPDKNQPATEVVFTLKLPAGVSVQDVLNNLKPTKGDHVTSSERRQ